MPISEEDNSAISDHCVVHPPAVPPRSNSEVKPFQVWEGQGGRVKLTHLGILIFPDPSQPRAPGPTTFLPCLALAQWGYDKAVAERTDTQAADDEKPQTPSPRLTVTYYPACTQPMGGTSHIACKRD